MFNATQFEDVLCQPVFVLLSQLLPLCDLCFIEKSLLSILEVIGEMKEYRSSGLASFVNLVEDLEIRRQRNVQPRDEKGLAKDDFAGLRRTLAEKILALLGHRDLASSKEVLPILSTLGAWSLGRTAIQIPDASKVRMSNQASFSFLEEGMALADLEVISWTI